MSRSIIFRIPGNEINIYAAANIPASGSATEGYWGGSAGQNVFGYTIARLTDRSVNGGVYMRSLPSSPGGLETSIII
jgi:hypothetical protein